jgi:electron transport complex protein RnfA
MSYIGIVVSCVFVSNALLTYGFEICNGLRWRESDGLASALSIALVNCLAAGMLWCARILVLAPFGLERLDLFVFMLISVPLQKALALTASKTRMGFLSRLGFSSLDLIVSNLVFGIALVASRGGYSFLEALIAGAASGLGYWLASTLLDSLRERLELSALPPALKGAPSMLISAGLMSMAFMGIDAALVRNLIGRQ